MTQSDFGPTFVRAWLKAEKCATVVELAEKTGFPVEKLERFASGKEDPQIDPMVRFTLPFGGRADAKKA